MRKQAINQEKMTEAKKKKMKNEKKILKNQIIEIKERNNQSINKTKSLKS